MRLSGKASLDKASTGFSGVLWFGPGKVHSRTRNHRFICDRMQGAPSGCRSGQGNPNGRPITDTGQALDGDLIGLSQGSAIGNDPSLANERVVTFRDVEPRWCDELLAAVDGVGLAVPDQPSVVVPPSDNRTWHVRLQIGGRTTRMRPVEPSKDTGMATLLHAVWNSLPVPLRCRSKIPPWLIDLHSDDLAVCEGATAKVI